ncbi:hypothetical protein MNBD_UNCLBAC01-1955 [hydrothermal vent metagenome]|uniref:Uncharacterized protein n=1 Tax=hydrothermal vent metagenome TaxID=652676 RepID=A0A3B1DF27_9ZZZZ
MLKALKNDENGFVFVVVLAVIIVVAVLVVSLISMNVSQVLIVEDEVKRIQAETLARGAMEYIAAGQISNSSLHSITFSETLGNFTYSVIANITDVGLTGYSANGISISVDY